MAGESTDTQTADLEMRRRAVLIARCKLDSDSVQRILACSQQDHVGFGEAALQLGLVNEQQLDDAYQEASDVDGNETATLIEKAIRKLSNSRGGRASSFALVPHRVRPSAKLTLVHDPYNSRSEKIRALRTELTLLARPGTVLTLLSSQAGEGRSQLAAELAIAFAQLDRKTLLIDADMRNPSQHKFFEGTDPHLGLAQALTSPDVPCMHEVEGVANLHLLAAGDRPSNPLELLSTDHFKKLIGQWRRHYDFVVVDTPPIAQFADGLAAVTVAGSALIVSRAHHTQYKSTKDMLRRLTPTQAQILGAVINHF